MNIYRDTDANYYLYTTDELKMTDSSFNIKKQYRHNDNDSNSLPGNFLNAVLKRENGTLLVMPWRKGIWQLVVAGNRFYPQTKPLGENKTPDGKANNRRVEFVKVK